MPIQSLTDKLEFLYEKAAGGEMTTWEEEFLASIDGAALSEAQRVKVEEIWEKYGR